MLALAAKGLTVWVSLVFLAAVPAPTVRRWERAIRWEVNGPVARYWHTPPIAFGAGGHPIVVETIPAVQANCDPPDTLLGCNWPDGRVYSDRDPAILAHEVIEWLVRKPIVDPCNAYFTRLGMWLPGFDTPRHRCWTGP